MRTKKTPKANLENKKALFIQFGLIVALSITIFAFEYRSYEQKDPVFISRDVVDVIPDIVSITQEEPQLQKPEQIYLMTSILNDVVTKGTGKSAQVAGIELAGKTGTTNDNVDAWFCGYSPSIQTIIWFGNDNNTPMRKSETGGKIAAPVFSYFYKKYLEIHPEITRNFTMPENVYTANILYLIRIIAILKK